VCGRGGEVPREGDGGRGPERKVIGEELSPTWAPISPPPPTSSSSSRRWPSQQTTREREREMREREEEEADGFDFGGERGTIRLMMFGPMGELNFKASD